MKKIRNMLFLCIFVFVICVGASFAWYVWQGSNLNVTVDFAGLDPYIDYRESSGDCGTSSLASSAIVFQKKDIGTNLDIYGQLYLHIDSATSNDLFKSSGYKWRLCKIDDNNETTLVSSGNFVGEAVGNNIPLSVDFELDNYSTSADTKYVIETYIDEDLNNNNLDISDSVMVSTWDPGAESVPSDQGILYIRNIEYSAGKITNLGFYSSKYEIVKYIITDSATEPSANDEGWVTITSIASTTEPGYVANVTNVNHTMTNINNICIKDSNGNVTCKSIEKQNDVINDLPSATLCVETTYNGEPHQLVSKTSGIGYTLSGYTGTNAGNYTITAKLNSGYQWSNGTTDDITFICSIVYEYYTITLDSNGGSGGTSTLYERYADGIYLDSGYTKKMTTSANAITVPTKTGYTFDGYYDGDTQMINADGYITGELTNMNRTDKTLTAHWAADSYSIVYVGNGNTGGSMASQTCTYDSNCTIASNGFTKTGYTFVGWTTNSDGTDDGYNWTGWSGTWTFVNGQYGIANNTLTLTAIWIEKVYQIYNSSGTSIGYANSLANAISSVPAGGTIKALKNNSSGAVTVNKNVTLNTNGYTITMNGVLTNNSGVTLTVSGSGTIDFPITCVSGDSAKCIENAGTFILNSGTINSDTINSGASLLYVSYSGVFEMNGGSLISSGHALTTGGETTIHNGSITSTGGNGISVIKGNLYVMAEATDSVDITGYYYGIIAPKNEQQRFSDINVSFSVENVNVLKVRATGGQWAAAYMAGSHSTYSVNTTINAGTFYGSGYGILNDAGNTLTINPSGLSSEVVYIESLSSSAIYNSGTLYVAESTSFSNGIPSAKLDSTTSPIVSVASNNSYVLTNADSGTLYYGYGVFGYSGQAASSDSSKRAIYLPGGTMYLVGGRIYHSNTVDSAFYRTGGTISVSGSFTTAYGQYSYSAQLGGFSFTNTKYSYKKS